MTGVCTCAAPLLLRLQAWKMGMTGYPLIDAAMKQLWSTGWMHNRWAV
jgi:deoxyribodipyrimidine photolyase